jgi:hypothetical protein
MRNLICQSDLDSKPADAIQFSRELSGHAKAGPPGALLSVDGLDGKRYVLASHPAASPLEGTLLAYDAAGTLQWRASLRVDAPEGWAPTSEKADASSGSSSTSQGGGSGLGWVCCTFVVELEAVFLVRAALLCSSCAMELFSVVYCPGSCEWGHAAGARD